jgi:hypothetical protein
VSTPEEGRTPEARTPEARTPEAGTPEARTPEARTPEEVAVRTLDEMGSLTTAVSPSFHQAHCRVGEAQMDSAIDQGAQCEKVGAPCSTYEPRGVGTLALQPVPPISFADPGSVDRG